MFFIYLLIVKNYCNQPEWRCDERQNERNLSPVWHNLIQPSRSEHETDCEFTVLEPGPFVSLLPPIFLLLRTDNFQRNLPLDFCLSVLHIYKAHQLLNGSFPFVLEELVLISQEEYCGVSFHLELNAQIPALFCCAVYF